MAATREITRGEQLPWAPDAVAPDLYAVLEWLDQRLDAAIGTVAQLYGPAAASDPYRGLAIGDDEPARLLARQPGYSLLYAEQPAWPELDPHGRLAGLIQTLGLSPFEKATLVIALAPEIDLRYERLYAYLQDDVTRRWPGIDLILNLLCRDLEAKLAARAALAEQAPLLRQQVLHRFSDPALPQSPLLGTFLRVDEGIVRYLLGGSGLDPRLQDYARLLGAADGLETLLLPDDLKARLPMLAGACDTQAGGPLLYLQGPYGVGKRSTAAAIAAGQSRSTLLIDGERLLVDEGLGFERLLRLALREARLQRAAICWHGFDALLVEERRGERETLLLALSEQPGVSFLTGNADWEPRGNLAELPFLRIELPLPGYAERARLWQQVLAPELRSNAELDLAPIVAGFRFSGGQIRDAAATARNLARRHDPAGGHMSSNELRAACRLQSNRKLGELARKITPNYTWQDIVLPEDCMAQLREICNSLSYRPLVFGDWGFAARLSLGKGLNVLFAGPSGTGKTMAAEIIAHELGLDLYKIDLATVVSKYIGETEKNLARIFAEAETSNAILFFDEADALFGKRSEVKDSHDRYANIEIGYLLQRMEEYEGITILATNLRRNMDEAFVRRMQFIVEFPFPDARYRRQIWERVWPAATPRDPALNLDQLAQRCEIAGGNIRNIALAAAFLAADDGRVVTIKHLRRATRREYQKMGKVMAEGELDL